MMICPESYYEFFLKGKSAEEIAEEIRELKDEIEELKRAIENPNYDDLPLVRPDEGTRLSCTRDYLAKAIEAYEEAMRNAQ